ncbi:hypothetical protein K488DRAFT_16932, partial [Vararia minispora EC-137]
LAHLGMRAYLSSSGQRLPLYEPRVSGKTVSAWVPARPGQVFAVCWQDLGTGFDTAAYIHIDGTIVPGRFLFGQGVAWRTGVRTGPQTERPFTF